MALTATHFDVPPPNRGFNRKPNSHNFHLHHLKHTTLHTQLKATTFNPSTPPLRPNNSTKNPAFLWNVYIRTCVEQANHQEAIDLYRQMRKLGVRSDYFTYPFLLKACSCALEFDEVPKIHGRLIKIGLDLDIYICNALIAVYAKMGRIDFARKVFDEMPVRDVVSWNSMMGGCVEVGDGSGALWYLRLMQWTCGLRVDRCTVIAGLTACSLEGCLREGKEMHCHVMRCGLELDHKVQVSVVDMYCKCGDVASAERFFKRIDKRSVVAWNALIAGYSKSSLQGKVFHSVREMQEEGFAPNSITMVNSLPSFVELGAAREGKTIHGISIRRCFVPNTILDTALIDMYVKLGELTCAETVFRKMGDRSLVSWNAMITGYVQNGFCMKALELFLLLLNECPSPDKFTFSGIVAACAQMMLLQNGRQIHSYAVRLGFGGDTLILNSLTYMYANCGDLHSSEKVFGSVQDKDVISWNTMIMAYAIHGQAETALAHFSKMQENGYRPNESTFVSVLTACSVSGLVSEGWRHFHSMPRDYGMEHQIEHFGCMVDLLGRVGELDAAESFIRRMPLAPTARIWGSLLTGSRNHNSIEYAEIAAENIFSLNHNNMGCYVILLNMYSEAGRWDDVERLNHQMKKEGIIGLQIKSTVEIDDKVYSFSNADRSYMQTNKIYDVVDFFSIQAGQNIRDYGRTFRVREAMLKEACSPVRHCVRLAVCYCLISTGARTPVLVKKNVRICNSCHDVMKRISKIGRREIIVGDSKIFHHFIEGVCSCGDYW